MSFPPLIIFTTLANWWLNQTSSNTAKAPTHSTLLWPPQDTQAQYTTSTNSITIWQPYWSAFELCQALVDTLPLYYPHTASQDTDIHTKIITDNADILPDFLFSGFNNSITTSIFPSSLKHAIITPFFKKREKNLKENYTPVSILPNVSKVFEWFLFKKISNFIEPSFSI